MKKDRNIAITLIFLLMITIGLLVINYLNNLPPTIVKVTYANFYNEDRSRGVTLKIKRHNTKPIYCIFKHGDDISEKVLVKKNKCSYNVVTDNYEVELDYNQNNKVTYDRKFNIDGVLGVKFNNKKLYMALNETFNLETNLDKVGNVDYLVKYNSSNEDIISIDQNGNLIGKEIGTSTITVTVEDIKETWDITVSNLIRPMELNNKKSIVPCNKYTNDQINELDRILASRVEVAGVGTRAAAVAVSRFLTLEFPYKVPYFYENGRISTTGVDGEGRYYRKGLYLGVDKQREITKVMAGPASWGCPLTNYEDNEYRKPNVRYPNGLDCSGYVSWILVNSGQDLGDIGAGFSHKFNYTQVGELNKNTYELLHSGKVRPGDLIGWDGHIAMIGGMTDTKIYVTESLLPGVIMDEYDYSSPSSSFYRRYDHIIDMSNVYKGDGNLRNMW